MNGLQQAVQVRLLNAAPTVHVYTPMVQVHRHHSGSGSRLQNPGNGLLVQISVCGVHHDYRGRQPPDLHHPLRVICPYRSKVHITRVLEQSPNSSGKNGLAGQQDYSLGSHNVTSNGVSTALTCTYFKFQSSWGISGTEHQTW